MAVDMDVFNDSFYADCGNMIDCNAKTQINNQLNGFDDENLLTVLRTFQETGCYTPLIKEELKFKIQERRLASGKEELVISETKPAIHELSTADIHRREARKEQNRRAARKYRVKQRAKASVVRQEMDKLESDNQQLMVEIKKLHQEKNELYQILQTHLKECVLGQLSPVVSPEPWQVTTSTGPWFQIPDCLTLTNL